MPNEVWGALAVVIASAITYLGVRFTSKQSAKASERTQVLEDKSIDAMAYERARESYEAGITQYLKEIARLQDRIDSLSQRIRELNRDIVERERAAREQRYEIEATVAQLVTLRAEYEKHLSWCNARVEKLRAQLEDREPPEMDHLPSPK